ncbi:MAG: hypothetical protein K1X47_07970 [Cyclobacteriaceae bacterium]|nr:hypothetical protein [Cyclobacteriaceae bacterium]
MVENSSLSQTNYNSVPLGNTEELKAAEKFVIEAAQYLFNSPHIQDVRRDDALRFIIHWMSDTKDYTYSIDETVAKFAKRDTELIGLYMAAMALYSLQHPDAAADPFKLKLGAVNHLLNYCEIESNGVKMSKHLRNLLAARKNGKLEQKLK